MGPITRAEFFRLLVLVFAGYFFSDEAKGKALEPRRKVAKRKPPNMGTWLRLILENNTIDILPNCIELIDIPTQCDIVDVTTLDDYYGGLKRQFISGFIEPTLNVTINYDPTSTAHRALSQLPLEPWYQGWSRDNKMGFTLFYPQGQVEGECLLQGTVVENSPGEPMKLLLYFQCFGETKARSYRGQIGG
jgi:hypothetical protein